MDVKARPSEENAENAELPLLLRSKIKSVAWKQKVQIRFEQPKYF